MINRAALILKYKASAVKWINDADPSCGNPVITTDYVNTDRTVYLLRVDVADNQESLEVWMKDGYEKIFEAELDGWYTDESLWPKNRTYTLFKKWFDIECNTVLIDTVGSKITDEDD